MSDHAADRIELSLPPDTRHAATLRVVVASLGADAGFTVDEIDDVRLGVSEVFATLVDHAPNARVRVGLEVADALTITMTSIDTADPAPFDTLAGNILRAVFDDVDTDSSTVRLVKQATEAGHLRPA